MISRSNIREGMTVYSSDGEKLGKVQSCDASMFVIEKGFFFPKDYVARYEDVSTIDGDDVRLSLSKDSFQRMRESGKEDEGWRAGSIETTNRPPPTDADVLATDYGLDRTGTPTGTTGAACPATNRDATGDKLFQKDSVSVPVHEEEIEVRKRPVVKEEVRLRKERFTEQRAADAEVRKERVEVEEDDRTRRTDRTDEDIGTTRRVGDEETSGTTRRMSDADDPFFGMPPRDDT